MSGGVHYTWSKSLSYTGGDIGATFQGDARSTVQEFFNWRAERSPSTGDTTHYFAADWVYDLPLFSSLGPIARHAIGGWQVSGIFRAQTGEPLVITQPSSISNSRPDYIGGDPVLPDWKDTLQYFNKAAFASVPISSVTQAAVRPGNLSPFLLRGPASWVVDIALAKNFRITESKRLQIRADAFNAFNHVNYNDPDNGSLSATFGKLQTAGLARTGQIGVRFTF